MTTRKKTEEQKAVELLKAKGYTIEAPLPTVRFGDVYEIEGYAVIILMLDAEAKHMSSYGCHKYGGYPIEGFTKARLSDYYGEELWMDEDDRRAGKYKYLGHVDLSKFIKTPTSK